MRTRYSVSQHYTVKQEDGGHITVWTWGHVTVSHSTTPWNMRTEDTLQCGHEDTLQCGHEDTLQCLTALHRETWGRRTHYSVDMRTRYSVSQHYTMKHEDGGHITVWTWGHVTVWTWGHVTVSHSTTPWNMRTEDTLQCGHKDTLQCLTALHRMIGGQKSTHYSISPHHTVRPEDRERYTL